MLSINEFRDCIKAQDVKSQTISIERLSRKWECSMGNPIVNAAITSLRRDGENYLISREDIFNEPDVAKRIVKLLIWGYPKGLTRKTTEAHCQVVNSCLNIAKEIGNDLHRTLSTEEFRALYNQIDDIKYIGQSTVTKILYFFDIKVNIPAPGEVAISPIIIDSNVVSSFKSFCEFSPFQENSLTADYCLDVMTRINEISENMEVTADQIELFLFKYGKSLKTK